MRSEVHTEIINWIIQKKGFKSYCELGVHEPQYNFDRIKCQFKMGVDPNGKANFTGTSDEYFDSNLFKSEVVSFPSKPIFLYKTRYDLVFIDGLHHADQVKKDFKNSLDCLNEGGVILIHDTNPAKEEFTVVPRNGLRGRWNGDVYKFVSCLSGFDFKTIDTDANGLTIVKRPVSSLREMDGAVTYGWFKENKKEYLKLCTQKEFEEWI